MAFIGDKRASGEERLYASPGEAALVATPMQVAGVSCLVAQTRGCERRKGAIVALDGSRLIRRIGRLVERGEVDPSSLPRIVGIDAGDPLNDFTPWRIPAFKEGARDFGGGAEGFFSDVVLPVAQAESAHAASASFALLGHSLGGLFCLWSLMRADLFDTYLIASPSTWYPGFVNKLARTPVQGSPRVAIACGRDEGAGHPEPIRGTRQDTDRAIDVLADKLETGPHLFLDDFDHHRGQTQRLKQLLAAF